MNFPYNLLSSLDILKKYQREIDLLFRHVRWIDAMTGEIVLTEEMIIKEFMPIILEQLPESMNDFQMTFADGSIHITLRGKIKSLSLKASNDVAIEKFQFGTGSHKMVLALSNESVEAEKGFINEMLIRIIRVLFRKRISQAMQNKLAEKYPGVTLDDHRKNVVIDLEVLPQLRKYLEIVVMGKPLLDLVEMKFMDISEKGIRFKLLILRPPISSRKDVIGVLGL